MEGVDGSPRSRRTWVSAKRSQQSRHGSLEAYTTSRGSNRRILGDRRQTLSATSLDRHASRSLQAAKTQILEQHHHLVRNLAAATTRIAADRFRFRTLLGVLIPLDALSNLIAVRTGRGQIGVNDSCSVVGGNVAQLARGKPLEKTTGRLLAARCGHGRDCVDEIGLFPY